jgi:SagB-type dehydrogenase family enzyme
LGYAHEYAAAIMQRGRIPMEPADFVPDWADRPRKAKYYPGTQTFPLPESAYPSQATVAAGCLPGDSANASGDFTLPALAGMLQDSYGLSGRRLAVQANTDLAALPHYTQANWSRGTASGGGLYPVSVYWVMGSSGPYMPGVYHYSPLQHSMQRLLVGNVTQEVQGALGEELPTDTDQARNSCDQYLVVGVKYWQNSFKYNSFSFHAVSMDVGALLQTWRMWARACGMEIAPILWFDEQRLATLLGLNAQEEGLFAVVPLRWAASPLTASLSRSSRHTPRVRRHDQERSRTVIGFETLHRIHRATESQAADRPAPGALGPCVPAPLAADLRTLPLPPATFPPTSVRQALRSRRSSFGRFDASVPTTAEQLAATLAACATARLGTDAEPEDAGLARLYVFVNHVQDIESGIYVYDTVPHTLRLLSSDPPGSFLQHNYFLSNYNLEQTGAVIVPTLRTSAVLDAVGDRGYRLVNAAVGAIAQTFYTAAAAVGLGAGVALGFDNISFVERLSLESSGEAPLLIMLLGNERAEPADFLSEIA